MGKTGNTDNTTKDWREQSSGAARDIANIVRRMAAKLTEGPFWQALGHLLPDGVTRETRNADVFGTLGFYSRPIAGANAEVVVVFPGGAQNPVIIGTRDEDMRKVVANLEQGQTAMCNRATIVLCKPDGTVEVRTPSGTAVPLATKADVEALADKLDNVIGVYNSHTHPVSGAVAGITGQLIAGIAPQPDGTTVLRAE